LVVHITATIQVIIDLPTGLFVPGRSIICSWFSQFGGQFDGSTHQLVKRRILERFNFATAVDAGRFIEMTEEFFAEWKSNSSGKRVTIRLRPVSVAIGSRQKPRNKSMPK
jgi:hypothetical protein